MASFANYCTQQERRDKEKKELEQRRETQTPEHSIQIKSVQNCSHLDGIGNQRNFLFKIAVLTLKVTSKFLKLKSHSQVPPSDIRHAREVWEDQRHRAAKAALGTQEMPTKSCRRAEPHRRHLHLIEPQRKAKGKREHLLQQAACIISCSRGNNQTRE